MSINIFVRYGLREPDYPKFVAMMLTAYIGGEYYALNIENLPSFNGIAELAPAESATRRSSVKSFSFGKSKIESIKRPLSLGKRIETERF